jgi:uncharacterized RmlC-like cupin family protein
MRDNGLNDLFRTGGDAQMGGPPITKIAPSDRLTPPAAQTSGMTREQVVSTDTHWVGYATTEPGMVSGWHHHGDNESYLYVLTGRCVLQFGAAGNETVTAEPGDFVHVPAGLVHRESNPTEEPSALIVFRVGSGAPHINVDGPDPS